MAKILVKVFAVLSALQFLVAVLAFVGSKNTNSTSHAVLGMALGLYVFWIFLAGSIMYALRNPVRAIVQTIPLPWWVKFIVFATGLALLEEVVTVAMTNTAPFWGVTMAQSHITISANYWDVVLTNSVVLLFPMFGIWAWILHKYSVSPAAAFLTWGITGVILEVVNSGPQHILEAGMWVFVYGLMIFLPAYSIPQDRPAKDTHWWQYPLFILVALLGIIPGGLLATIFKHLRPPHFFTAVK